MQLKLLINKKFTTCLNRLSVKKQSGSFYRKAAFCVILSEANFITRDTRIDCEYRLDISTSEYQPRYTTVSQQTKFRRKLSDRLFFSITSNVTKWPAQQKTAIFIRYHCLYQITLREEVHNPTIYSLWMQLRKMAFLRKGMSVTLKAEKREKVSVVHYLHWHGLNLN